MISSLTPEAEILHVFTAARLTLATAERCTGGAIAARLTSLPGASAVYRGGVVAYSNDVKAALLGVDPAVIDEHGAVSEAVVRQMALGTARACGADYAVATSGIAGPGGGSEAKPVGTVWMAVAAPGGRVLAGCYLFPGDRAGIIGAAAEMALRNVIATFNGAEALI